MNRLSKQRIEWDIGTAYDFFISLWVLHEPEHLGLRGSWAAGVRSRLPGPERELLQRVATISIELRFHRFYRGEKTMAEIHDWLYARGFHLAQLKRGLGGKTLAEVDACFFNRALVAESPRAAATLCYWADRYRLRKRRFI